MGVDFLDKTKGTFEKTWETGFENLATRDLFTVQPERIRTLPLKPTNGSAFSKNELYELQSSNGQVTAYINGEIVGICESPGEFFLRKFSELGGKTLGTLNRMRERSGLADIAVYIGE